jgi:hypothetical protein
MVSGRSCNPSLGGSPELLARVAVSSPNRYAGCRLGPRATTWRFRLRVPGFRFRVRGPRFRVPGFRPDSRDSGSAGWACAIARGRPHRMPTPELWRATGSDVLSEPPSSPLPGGRRVVKMVGMGGCKAQGRGGRKHKTGAGMMLQRERPFAAPDQLAAPIFTTSRGAQGGEDGRDGAGLGQLPHSVPALGGWRWHTMGRMAWGRPDRQSAHC